MLNWYNLWFLMNFTYCLLYKVYFNYHVVLRRNIFEMGILEYVHFYNRKSGEWEGKLNKEKKEEPGQTLSPKKCLCGSLTVKCGSCENRRVSTFNIFVSHPLFHVSLISISLVDRILHFCKGPNLKYFLFKFPNDSPFLRPKLWYKSLTYSQVESAAVYEEL